MYVYIYTFIHTYTNIDTHTLSHTCYCVLNSHVIHGTSPLHNSMIAIASKFLQLLVWLLVTLCL